jgi:predicted HTH transcriptional regulator
MPEYIKKNYNFYNKLWGMSSMDKKKVLNLIRKEEGIKLDFKQKLELEIESGKKELAKDVCAIANSKGGRGYILVGIEDKTKRIIGLSENNAISEEQVQQIISSRCEPPIPITVDVVAIENKTVAVITIYDGEQKPYQLRENGAFYIRRGSTTDTMRKQELVSAFQESLNLNVETCPILKSGVESLNNKIIDKYFASKGILINDDNRSFLMESASIITKDKEGNGYSATLGGLLVFSDTNSVYIPHNMVRIVNRVNEEKGGILTITGNLMDMIDKSEVILKDVLPPNYPYNAVLEGVKNAILYRDYSIFFKEIEIVISSNSVTVISPGNLIKSNQKYENGSDYFRRNMWIYEKLITLDDDDRFSRSGRGFSRMKKLFRNYGKVIFINSYERNFFKVIFPGVSKFL